MSAVNLIASEKRRISQRFLALFLLHSGDCVSAGMKRERIGDECDGLGLTQLSKTVLAFLFLYICY